MMATQSFGNVEQWYSTGPAQYTKGKVLCPAKAYPCFCSLKYEVASSTAGFEIATNWLPMRLTSRNFKAFSISK